MAATYPSDMAEEHPLVAWLGRIAVATILGVLLGGAYTLRSLQGERRSIVIGPWHTMAQEGSTAIDPYALAAVARAGLLPLGTAEGVSFLADMDDGGRPLDPRCAYRVTGPMPPARFWTLSLLDEAGFPVANAAKRYGFTSSEILRLGAAPASVTVAPQARSGNWLPSDPAKPYQLMLRLYDTSLGTDAPDKVRLPTIIRADCS